MQKILLVFSALVLFGCSISSPETPQPKINTASKTYIQEQVQLLQQKIDNDEITENQAQEKLKNILQENQKLNDGSTESILKKFEMISPETAELLKERIRENHPEALAE